MAQLHGKMPVEVWLGSEDLLTSAVLGTLKNLPPSLAVELLARARPLDGTLSPTLRAPLAWHFWPRWARCEPDVVIEDERNLCAVEAKLYSDFGEDEGSGRQLRREWIDGLAHAREEGKTLWLVALTNHATLPEAAMRAQLRGSQADLTHVCWLSWFEAGRLLREVEDAASAGWREDLLELLQRMGLAPFDGFGEVLALAQGASAGRPWALRLRPQLGAGMRPGFGPSVAYARRLGPSAQAGWRLAPPKPMGRRR